MIKKISLTFVTLLICTTLTICVSARLQEIQNLNQEIQNNNSKIQEILTTKEALHNTAELFRQYEHINNGFDAVLGEKWAEIDRLEKEMIFQNNEINKRITKLRILQKKEEEAQKVQAAQKQETSSQQKNTYLGVFELTAYCMGTRTATGTTPTPNRTIAVDPRVIPYGTKVYIEGYGTYTAEDCGGAVKGKIIDIYMKGYDNCIQFGRRKAKVYLVE